MLDEVLEAMMAEMLEFLEEQFVKHEPEMQAALIKYAKSLALQLEAWAKDKLPTKD